MSDKLYDVRLCIHFETAKAWRVSDDGDDENAVWLAKSQVEMYPETVSFIDRKKTAEFSIPEWLAKEKELI